VDPAALANTAAQRFLDGAEASFFDCFENDVEVYWEPALAQRPILGSRDALKGWLERTREPRSHVALTVTEAQQCGDGAVCELIIEQPVVPQEVWRIALAVCVSGDKIREVRAFWARETAVEWLVGPR
jgi:hypothetical protein